MNSGVISVQRDFLASSSQRLDLFSEFGVQIPDVGAMPGGQDQRPWLQLLSSSYGLPRRWHVFGPLVVLGQAVLVVHPEGIPEVFGVVVVLVHDPDAFIEVPHGVVDLEAEFLPDPDMVLERCCEVAQHGIVLGGKRDQVGGIRLHDPVLAPVQVVQGDGHVERGTDV